eukprot:3351864-Alexandrium_andersonii.AAC.1
MSEKSWPARPSIVCGRAVGSRRVMAATTLEHLRGAQWISEKSSPVRPSIVTGLSGTFRQFRVKPETTRKRLKAPESD